MSDTISVLRVMEIATGRSLEGGREIRYVLDGKEGYVNGQVARDLEAEATASMGLLGDLPAILVEYLNLVSADGQSPVDAGWMTTKELVIHQQNKRQSQRMGQGISTG